MHCRTQDRDLCAPPDRRRTVQPSQRHPGASRSWLGELAIVISARDHTDVVRLHGELDRTGAGALHACFRRLEGRHVLVDLKHLRFLDAAGMSALVIARAHALAAGKSWTVRGANGAVRRALDVAGLLEVMEGAAG